MARSLKGRCKLQHSRVCFCVCSYVCSCVCVYPSSPPPHNPAHTVGLNSRIPPTPGHDPSPPFPHLYPQAIARRTLGKNYPVKSARVFVGKVSGTEVLITGNLVRSQRAAPTAGFSEHSFPPVWIVLFSVVVKGVKRILIARLGKVS